MNLKLILFHFIPKPLINNVLLLFPFLYKTKLVNYETSLISEKNGIHELLNSIEKIIDVDGDIIECGAGRCGATVIMAKFLKLNKINKKIYSCDTFTGFDKNELADEKHSGLSHVSDDAFTHTSLKYVTKKIKKLGYSDYIILKKGLFQNTLPDIKSKFSLALIDCDLKKSLIFAAETIWPHLSKGGIMLFDDYTSDQFEGAKLGIDFIVKKFENELDDFGLLGRLYYIKKNNH